MLREVTSVEISEWAAYYAIKEKQEQDNTAAAEARAKAKRENR